MKNTILKITLVALVALGTTACKNENKEEAVNTQEVAEASETAVTYTVDTAASKIMWEGSKPTGKHHGTVGLSAGTISTKNGNLEAGTFTIDMNSISSDDLEGNEKASLEAHLKGTAEGKTKDFFNVTDYPTAKFDLTGIEDANGTTIVNGNLTIKEKSNNVSFPATISMDGNKMTLTSESFKIDRTQWEINFMSKSIFDDLKEKFIDDEIVMKILLVATK